MRENYPDDFREQILGNELIVPLINAPKKTIKDIRDYIAKLINIEPNSLISTHGTGDRKAKQIRSGIYAISYLAYNALKGEGKKNISKYISELTGLSETTILSEDLNRHYLNGYIPNIEIPGIGDLLANITEQEL